jgi:hypothetical protein
MDDGVARSLVAPRVTERLATIVGRATGRAVVDIAGWERRPLPHRVANMATRSLEVVSGRLSDGTAWSVVAKTLHPASDSPVFASIPPEHRASVLSALDWLDEPRVYRSGLADALPDGLRMPTVLGIDEGPGRITIWMEDVADTGGWDLDRYRRTAACLGRLAGRWPGDRAIDELGMTHRDIETMFFGKISNLDLVVQADDAFWRQPAVAEVVDDRHRRDLYRLAELMPGMIAKLEEIPRGLCHGDATPDNFREPGDGTTVGIDWSYCNVDTLASDLGQLLAGRCESGAVDLDSIEVIASHISVGYHEGVADEGVEVGSDVLERAWVTHLAIRSVFSALVVDHRPNLDDDARFELLRRRAALARFGLDFALRLATTP